MRRVLTGALLAVMPAALHAQEGRDTIRLGKVVVTATRLETSVRDVPGSVTVIAGAELAARGVRTLADALRSVPGAAIAQSGGMGGITSLFMRGGESDYVQVLVDGVQMNLPGGSFNWGHLRTEDIDRIEVVRGPVSVLYGSDAVAGVVQIFTRSGGAPRLTVNASGSRGDRPRGFGGEHDTHAVDAGLTGETSLAGYSLRYGATAIRAGSSGLYELNSDYDDTQLSGKLRLLGARSDIALMLHGTDNEYHYPTSGAGIVGDANQFATGETRSAALDGGFAITPRLELRTLAAYHTQDSRTDNPDDGTDGSAFWSTAGSVRRSIEGRVNAALPRNLVATVGAEREWQDDESAFESVSTFGTFRDSTDNDRANTGFFAQLHGSIVPRLTVTVGGRIDENQQFGRFNTGRVAASWRFRDDARVHAAAGTAFKEPTFFENYAVGFTRGNPDLEPEESRSWEIGSEFDVAGVTLGATWFDQRFTNLIQYTGAAAPEQPNYSNVGRATARGLEVQAHTAFPRISLNGHYTFTRTRTQDEGFGEDPAFEDGAALLRRAEHQGVVNAAMKLSAPLRFTAAARFVGEREDLDFTDPVNYLGTRVTLPSYVTVDLGFGYGALRYGAADIDISVNVRNALDEEYEEVFNFPAARRRIELNVRAGLGM